MKEMALKSEALNRALQGACNKSPWNREAWRSIPFLKPETQQITLPSDGEARFRNDGVELLTSSGVPNCAGQKMTGTLLLLADLPLMDRKLCVAGPRIRLDEDDCAWIPAGNCRPAPNPPDKCELLKDWDEGINPSIARATMEKRIPTSALRGRSSGESSR
jgi:hypothetical protein